jgi:3D (Asp-Asp-Asp) domain-containing protein
MIIARSVWRKAFATAVAAIGFVSLYEVTMLDSQYAARLSALRETTALPFPGARLVFSATAYCRGITTTSGVAVRTGIAAADAALLPVGSIVEVDSLDSRYNGIYTIMDTGPSIQGREVDIYMWNCDEAVRFGRRPIHLVVLRLGWNPRATKPTFMGRLFKRPEPAKTDPPPLPSRSLLPAAGVTNQE